MTFDGPTVVDSCCWMVSAFNSSDLTFANLKMFGGGFYKGDGRDYSKEPHGTVRHSSSGDVVGSVRATAC